MSSERCFLIFGRYTNAAGETEVFNAIIRASTTLNHVALRQSVYRLLERKRHVPPLEETLHLTGLTLLSAADADTWAQPLPHNVVVHDRTVLPHATMTVKPSKKRPRQDDGRRSERLVKQRRRE